MDDDALIAHLERTRIAGSVQTTVGDSRRKIRLLLDGHPECTFGLSDWRDASIPEVEEAMRVTAGVDLARAEGDDGRIDPRATLAGIRRYAAGLAPYLREGGANVLIATGHPTGLLQHGATLGRELVRRGNTLLFPHSDGPTVHVAANGVERTVRYIGGVACAFSGGSLDHTHLSVYMETMLDDLAAAGERVDLVIADHGMAGAAVERGIPTLSIADVNDPALPLAHLRGRHDAVLVLDDNVAPNLFATVTEAILERAAELA